MKLNLDWSFKNYDGKDLEVSEDLKDNVHAGRQLSAALGASRESENVIKFWGWAQAFFKKEEVEIDKADFSTLRSFIEKSQAFTLFAKGQLLSFMDSVKEEAEKK